MKVQCQAECSKSDCKHKIPHEVRGGCEAEMCRYHNGIAGTCKPVDIIPPELFEL